MVLWDRSTDRPARVGAVEILAKKRSTRNQNAPKTPPNLENPMNTTKNNGAPFTRNEKVNSSILLGGSGFIPRNSGYFSRKSRAVEAHQTRKKRPALERLGALGSIKNAPKTPPLFLLIILLATAGCSNAPAPDRAAVFIDAVRPMLSMSGLGKLHDADLTQIANDTCRQVADGRSLESIMKPIRVANTSELAADLAAVTTAALLIYCPKP